MLKIKIEIGDFRMKLLKSVDFSDIKEGEIFAITRDCSYLIDDDPVFPKYKSIKKIEIYCKKEKIWTLE